MTVKDILPSHPVEIMVRTNYPESLLTYLSSERIEQGLLVGYCSWDGENLTPAMVITILWMKLFQNMSMKRTAV